MRCERTAVPPVWTVQLEPGVWIASWDGDPGRTLRGQNAKQFVSRRAAQRALIAARKYRAFAKACLVVLT